MEDTLWAGLSDSYCKLPMGVTAENLAEKYSISRSDCDEFALASQQRWAAGKTHFKGILSSKLGLILSNLKISQYVFIVHEKF